MTRVMTNDALLFHSMAMSMLIESGTPVYVSQLMRVFEGDPRFSHWLSTTWQHEEVGHGELLRQEIAKRWPDFDAGAAQRTFMERYTPLCDAALLRPTPALEALARCVTEAQAAAGYRALASFTAGTSLAALFAGMAADEARHYSRFRRAFDERAAAHGRVERLRLVLARTLLVRDEDLPLAFVSLAQHWRSPPPFELPSYAAYLDAVDEQLRENVPALALARMLLKPVLGGTWFERIAEAALPKVLHQLVFQT
jgi:hypothetical protein